MKIFQYGRPMADIENIKRGYSKALYHQRNKDETIVSVIKRLFGEHIRSRHVITQNRELSLRCIAYNMHRLTNLVIIIMISKEPQFLRERKQISIFSKKNTTVDNQQQRLLLLSLQ